MSLRYDTILATVTPGQTCTVDTLRDVIEAAQLTRFERGELFRHGIRAGLLTTRHLTVASTHPAAKARRVQIYERTHKPVRGAA